MAEDLFDYGDDSVEPQRKDSLFLWTVLILLLIGLAFACWLGSFYIFGHPEEARSYAILKKLKKIEAPRRFDVTAAPIGEFLSPQTAYERFSIKPRLELAGENAELLRIYIKNYTETKKVVPYLRGKFDVIQARELTSSDLFPMGTVALLQATDYAQIVVEHLFPATGPNLEKSKQILSPGYPFSIEKTNDVTAVIHAERLADGRMLLTVVPLHYPSYALKGGIGTFASEPPAELNVAAGLPITREAELNAALKRYAQLKGEAPAPPPEDTAKPAPTGPEVVRLDTLPIGKTAPESGTLPEPTVAAAVPVHPVRPTPALRATASDLAMNRPPATPRATPAVTQVLTPRPAAPATTPNLTASMPPTPAPAPVAPALSPSGVPLKPFVQSKGAIAPPSETGGSWRTYAPGTQPKGRTITPTQALGLVDQLGGERLYLVGNFVVTAKGDNKAVFRPRGEPLPPGSAIRIIAEFPNGALPPPENEVFTRDATRAFEVKSISRADDGQTVNVEVREVTRD